MREKFSLYNPISILETDGKLLRTAAYCRVSTDSDDQQGSFENQVRYYTESINSNPSLEMVGIYGDEGKSGVTDKGRTEFNHMMDDCRAGKIDLVITKSVSRFARNTRDCLKYTRELKDLNIAVFFEKENINTLDSKGELLLTILSVLAQEESRNLSQNVIWSYESLFEKGKVVVNAKRFYGFTKNSRGMLVPDPVQAPVVRRMYREYLDGYSLQQIAGHLNEDKVPGVFGEPRWASGIVRTVLSNEKNKGDLLLQKTVTDFFSKRSVKNVGQKRQYYIENDHKGIVSRDSWDAVQMEMERRVTFRHEHNIKTIRYMKELDPFQGKVICSGCGDIYVYRRKGILKCRSKCDNRLVSKSELEGVFTKACKILFDKQQVFIEKWRQQRRNGNPLQRERARQMLSAIPRLSRVYTPEDVLKVLESIEVMSDGSYSVKYLDGTEIRL